MREKWRPYALMAGIGAISGFVSFLSCYATESSPFWSPGVVFGFAVALTLSRYLPIGPLKIAASSLVGTGSYYAACVVFMQLGTNSSLAASGSAGMVGSALFGSGLMALLGRRGSLRVLGMMTLAGTAVGFVFGSLSMFGFPVWQAATAATLGGLFVPRKEIIEEILERCGCSNLLPSPLADEEAEAGAKNPPPYPPPQGGRDFLDMEREREKTLQSD
jgi:hypothetical protein